MNDEPMQQPMQQPMQRGRITKIVRVPSSDDALHANGFEGYGILRSEHGKDVFFVGTVVADQLFEELEIGKTVYFSPEPGPLSRASKVWLQLRDCHLESNSMSRTNS